MCTRGNVITLPTSTVIRQHSHRTRLRATILHLCWFSNFKAEWYRSCDEMLWLCEMALKQNSDEGSLGGFTYTVLVEESVDLTALVKAPIGFCVTLCYVHGFNTSHSKFM